MKSNNKEDLSDVFYNVSSDDEDAQSKNTSMS